jgi:predicted component of type VI protein secretion system
VARGWESKSVEDQQASFAEALNQPKRTLTSAELIDRRTKDGLELSRKHLSSQLEQVKNPQHRAMLQSAIAELDKKISQFS